MDRKNFFYALEFKNELILNNHIYSVSTRYFDALIHDWQFDLKLILHTCSAALISETMLVSIFQQSRTQLFMYFNCKSDYFV